MGGSARWALIGVLLLMPLAAEAQVTLYDNGVSHVSAAYAADDRLVAADFTLGTASVVTGFRITLGASSLTERIFWDILTDARGAPGSSLYSGTAVADRGSPPPSSGVVGAYYYRFGVGPSLPLDPGVYWLALNTGTLSGGAGSSVLGGNGDLTRPRYSRLVGESTWSEPSFSLSDVDFVVLGEAGPVVPEPSTVVLLGMGLLGLVGTARASRRERQGSPDVESGPLL